MKKAGQRPVAGSEQAGPITKDEGKRKTMNTVGVIRNTEKDDSLGLAHRIEEYLLSQGKSCYISDTGEDLPPSCEAALVLGGDGTLLRAAKIVLERQLPLLGVNLGTLGYLAEISTDSLYESIDLLLRGEYTVEKRMMLYGSVYSGGKKVYSDTALNDIVIRRVKQLRSFRISSYVNGQHLNTYSADGVIVSTATGSTGYSLSVGGPIVSPEAQIIMLTPLAAHSLSSRSIILPGADLIRIQIDEGRSGLEDGVSRVGFDGEELVSVGVGDYIEIRRARLGANIIKINNISFLEVLRSKMTYN